MPGEVQFEEDDNSYSQSPFTAERTEPKGIIGLVIRAGIAKNEKQATYFLLGIMLLNIIIIAFLLFGGGSSNSSGPSPLPVNRVEI